jgi:5-methyltetrahydrofolate--homocysteine methyltransferase
MIKPDWDQSKKRFEAWWHGECVDRVLLQVHAPRKHVRGAPRAPAVPPTYEEQRMNADYRIAVFEHQMAHTYYGGDAFPYLDTHIGPGTMSLYLGATPTFMPETVWYNKCIDDITAAPVPGFDETNRFWQATLDLVTKGVERLAGRALVSFPDLIEGLDTISSLVGNDELLFYLVDAPEHVHRFQNALVHRYFDYHDRLYEIVKDEQGGSCFSAFQYLGAGQGRQGPVRFLGDDLTRDVRGVRGPVSCAAVRAARFLGVPPGRPLLPSSPRAALLDQGARCDPVDTRRGAAGGLR